MIVTIAGAGPAGLLLAYLLKRQDIADAVTVFEQHAEASAFGFGVALAGNGLSRLTESVPELVSALMPMTVPLSGQRISVNNTSFEIPPFVSAVGIARAKLLRELHGLCRRSGVDLRFGTPLEYTGDHDLLVAADGSASTLRQKLSNSLGLKSRTLTNRFAWYGVEHAFDKPALSFKGGADGCYIAHYYPFDSGFSTFVAEADAAAWARDGLAEMTGPERRRFVERLFEHELGGRGLLENRSAWRQYTVVALEKWSHSRTVLIGDAARPAHPSIGQGTRLAFDDAVALAEALRDNSSIDEALAGYEEVRRPVRAKLDAAAELSFTWYEHVGKKLDQPIDDFVLDFMTRTGRIDVKKLQSILPGIVGKRADFEDGFPRKP